ncbi:MAG TPA: MFS transporter [Thermodesulfobacteriota bacterium]|nr:MFS transporter [Thermodesulfobacteriota bacterium]
MVFFKNPLRFRWWLLGILGLLYFLACLHRISPTIIARDLIQEFGADATALGLMASAYFYLYAAIQPPVGFLSDTLGPRRVVTLFTLIACLGCLVFGLAPSMFIAGLGRALIGIGVGGIFIPGLKIFAHWFRPKEFAGVTGLFLALGNAGNLSASLPLTYLVLLIGWRSSFLGIAALSLILGISGWLILRDRPEDKGWPPITTYPQIGQDDKTTKVSAGDRLRLIFQNSEFWLITLSYFFYGGPGLTFQGLWVIPYLTDIYGYTRLQAGGLLMVLPLGFIAGAPLIGFLADHLAITRKWVLVFSLMASLSCWLVFFLTGGKPHPYFLMPLFFVMGLFGGGALSLYMTMIKEIFPIELTGTAIGLMNPAAFLATALFQPFSGYLMDAVGRIGSAYPLEAYQRVFTSFFISMGVGFLLIFLIKTEKNETR